MKSHHYHPKRSRVSNPHQQIVRLQAQLRREQLRNQELTHELKQSRQQLEQQRAEFIAQINTQLEHLLDAAPTPEVNADPLVTTQAALETLKARMIRTISHEYRTPLTIISLAAKSLAQNTSRLNPQQRHQCFAQIQQATQYMIKMVNEVLWISQAEAGEIMPHLSKIPLGDFCNRTIKELERLNPQWHDRIQSDLPALATSIYNDPFLLQHILLHLLTNALKYSEPEQAVELYLTVERQTLQIWVRDHGLGIPEAERACIYDCFHRAENVGTRPGTGLGLAIVKKCVELLEGKIGFQSQLDQGTAFCVQLPLVKQSI
ncbi:MAG: HAMP domain-containing histidine kinase [Spirulina sp. SIO3F2]|nr:HAMP domain-containing histidine kinase [Spirulina sp. SIO3F2]